MEVEFCPERDTPSEAKSAFESAAGAHRPDAVAAQIEVPALHGARSEPVRQMHQDTWSLIPLNTMMHTKLKNENPQEHRRVFSN